MHFENLFTCIPTATALSQLVMFHMDPDIRTPVRELFFSLMLTSAHSWHSSKYCLDLSMEIYFRFNEKKWPDTYIGFLCNRSKRCILYCALQWLFITAVCFLDKLIRSILPLLVLPSHKIAH